MNIFKNMKLLLAVYKQWGKLKEAQMNSGFGSSSFIMTVLGAVVAIGMFFIGSMPAETTAIIVASLVSVYNLSRAIIKASASKKDDEVFNKVLVTIKPLADKLGVELKPIE